MGVDMTRRYRWIATIPIVALMVGGVLRTASADEVTEDGIDVVLVGDATVINNGEIIIDPTISTMDVAGLEALGIAADDSIAGCLNGHLCLYTNASYTGTLVQFDQCCPWENLGDYHINNDVSSWRNRRANDARLAAAVDGGGDKTCLAAESASPTMPAGWDDLASSARLLTTATC
jgi:hypothetical protein